MPQKSEKKGTFGAIGLTIAKKYIYPFSRKRMMLVGAIAGVAVLALFLVNAFLQKKSLFSQGPLSVNHANIESDCAKCHESFKAVSNTKCSICHEKTNDKIGIYTFAAHYVYKSADVRRLSSSLTGYSSEEIPCASCHSEHKGRDAMITQVPDVKCVRCHDYGSFNKLHPQFEFVRNRIPDDSTLLFTHVRHTKEVLKKIGSVYLEQACLYCHQAQPDGKNFEPINFDMRCAECHQPVALEDKSPKLEIKDPNAPGVPGVETLQMIQNRHGPGTTWAFYTNQNEFTMKPNNKIVKSPVYHKDPWVLENLKLIRQTLYSDLKLSDLVNTSGMVSLDRRDRLYTEALQTLQDYLSGLRGRPEPEVQDDLVRIDSLLKAAQMKIGRLSSAHPDSLFILGNENENPNLTSAQKKDFEEFAFKVARPCLECHIVEHASILRVATEQKVLHRAEFNHRAHILQRRCLECHTDIPIEKVLAGDTIGVASKDRSSTQNIPMIENCFECHTSQEASNRCVTCHYMHPNKMNRSNLQLFVQKN